MRSLINRVAVFSWTLLLAAGPAAVAQTATAPTSASKPAAAPRFELTLDPAVHDKPYTGRVYLMTTTHTRHALIHGPSWFNPEPFFSLEVRDWKPGATLVFDPAAAHGCPMPLAELPAGPRQVQAALDTGDWTHRIADAPGNVCSSVVSFTHDPQNPPTVAVKLDRHVPQPPTLELDHIEVESIRSRLLSDFHQRDVYLRAVVALPAGYGNEPERFYPVIYIVPGFGATIDALRFMGRIDPFAAHGLEIIRVFLDPDCPTGHSVFADSANNGPVAQALVEELLPYLETAYRVIREPGTRYVTGHSSGGWSSLWLQVTYPDLFGGVWSLAPDPVDFHAFQLTDIYDPTDNMYYERDGTPRAAARTTPMGTLYARDFCRMEQVLGRGGQMQSFEAVFSPRGGDGKPLALWDRETGRIHPAVAEAWSKYDIRRKLADGWKSLGPKLAGKLHVICGEADTFFLEKAVHRLRDQLKELGSDADVQLIPGADHGLTVAVHDEVARQVAAQFTAWRARQAASQP